MATNIIVQVNNDDKQMAPSSLCPLCCEEDLSAPLSSRVTLSNCNHQSCKTCLVKWIEKEEASGQTTPPTCPFCRLAIEESGVVAILGRPFHPRVAIANEPNGQEEIDDLTLHWLNEQTIICVGCSSRVEKESGCDLMECLCGYRFCYNCGSPGGCCNCNNGHRFLNNYEGSTANAPVRDASGRVDLRSTLLRRKVRKERERQTRMRGEEEFARWKCSNVNAAVCTANGRWLFSSSSIRMLKEQLGYNQEMNVRYKRLLKKNSVQQPSTSIDVSWVFLEGRGAETRALQQLLARDKVKGERQARRQKLEKESCLHWSSQIDTALIWLFLPKCTELKVLKQLLAQDDVHRSRERRRERLLIETQSHWNKRMGMVVDWLFLPKTAGLRVLAEADDATRKHQERSQKDPGDADGITQVLSRGAWLFEATPPGSLRVAMRLSERLADERKRRDEMRARARWKDEEEPEIGIDAYIMSGVWLFRTSTLATTIKHLIWLYKHSEYAEEKAEEKQFKELFDVILSCNEKQNLDNVLLLFEGKSNGGDLF